MSAARRCAAAAALLLAVGLLAGCGKKSSLEPPPGEAANYTYPRAYPAPLPGSQPGSVPPRRNETAPSKLSPFPDSGLFPTTTTY